MNAIKVKKDVLLSKLRENRRTHSTQFEKASNGYRTKVIEALEAQLKDARAGKLPRLIFNLPMPIDQTAAYDRAIGMLELTVEKIIELEEHDYQQYVLDQWSWSAQTTATNSAYLAQ